MGAPAVVLTFAIALVAPLRSQSVVWERFGDQNVTTILGSRFGTEFLGDVDGDGHSDVIQEVGLHPLNTMPNEYRIFSGATGVLLDRIVAQTFRVELYHRMGDLDGDGVEDFLRFLGFLDPLQAQFISSRTREHLFTIPGPPEDELLAFEWNGFVDLNGDGVPDLLAPAGRVRTGPNARGVVYAYDGRNGEFLFRMQGPPGVGFADSVSEVGDLDGDDCEDFLVGGANPVNCIFAYSGATRELLGVTEIDPVVGPANFTMSRCGDMTGDGVPEFAGSNTGPFLTPGLVRVFDGASFEVLYEYRREELSTGFGQQLAGGEDLDLDGVPDLLTSSAELGPDGVGGTLFAYSGRDGELLFKVYAETRPAEFGALGFGGNLSLIPPEGDDPFPRFAASQGFDRRRLLGRLAVFSGRPLGVDLLGSGCGPEGPRMGMRRLDWGTAEESTRIHLSNAPPGAVAYFVLGWSSEEAFGQSLPLSLSCFGLPECSLHVSIDGMARVRVGSEGNDRGYASIDVPIRLSERPDRKMHGQWIIFDESTTPPALIGVSNALSFGF